MTPAVRPLRLSPARMYERVLAGDADYDGRFFTGVLTTGIYCLPSCKARKPKPGNVRFFPTAEAARAFGLRPCRKCHPDDFARGADPLLETIEELVREMRGKPGAFADARAVVRRSGFGTTRAFELFRRHYHATPADLLMRARVDWAKARLLQSSDTISRVALDAGFEAISAFHDNFRRLTGLTPAVYRQLRDARAFEIALPEDYALGYFRRAMARDPESRDIQLETHSCRVAVRVHPGAAHAEGRDARTPSVLHLALTPTVVAVSCPASAAVDAHRIVVDMLGLGQDGAAFERLSRRLGFARLVSAVPGLRISLTPTVFDGLLWAIIGQQINFSFACRLKRRLLELCGTPVDDGLIAPPTPADVARLEPDQLVPLQFSTQKAEYLIHTARMIVEGRLPLQERRGASATRAARTLLGIRGLGPWSVNYLMMRALGFADCVPLGDTGVTSGLLDLMKLDVRPDADATRRLMNVFSPYRSLATAHLWMLNKTVP